MPDFTLQKPSIPADKILSDTETIAVDFALKKQGRILIHSLLTPMKNDYIDDYDRGTVKYTPSCRNYSFHSVLIPDGTIVKDTNFTQKTLRAAIQGKDLIFISCNLVNNEIDPSWKITDCNTAKIMIEDII